MKKRTAIVSAFFALMPLTQPLMYKTGLLLTSSVILISVSENAYANPPLKLRRAKDSQGRTMKFYIERGYGKVKNGNRSGGNSDYSIAINMHENDPYGGDIYHYQIALTMRGISKLVMGNKRGACFDFSRAKDYVNGFDMAKEEYNEHCR